MRFIAANDIVDDLEVEDYSPVASIERVRTSSGISTRPRVLMMPEFMSIGGGQKHFLRKALWLKRNGIFVVVASAGGVMEAELAEAGIPHLTLAALGMQGAYVNAWETWGQTIAALVDFIDMHRITVINAHPIVPILAAREVALLREVGVAYEFLGGQTHLIPPEVWTDEVHKNNFFTGRGPIGKQVEDRLHLDESLITKIPWPVDVKPFQTAPETTLRDELELPDDAFVVLNACRHDHDKLVHIYGLVDAMQRLMPKHPHLHVVFAGDGTDHDALVKYVCDRLPADRAHVVGMYENMNAALHGCDALYGMGSVCFEASIAHKPVLVAPATTLMGTPGSFADDQMTIGYFREYDFHTIGDVVDGVRFSTIDERLEPLITDAACAKEIADRAHDIVVNEHHIDRVMEQWLIEYQRRHDAAMSRRLVSTQGFFDASKLYPCGGEAVQLARTAADLIESAFSDKSGAVKHELDATDDARTIRVALALPHDPAAVVPPHVQWREIIEPLAALGIDARIALTPDSASQFGDVDAIIVVSLMDGSTFQRWATVVDSDKPILLVGEYRDDRMWRSLWRLMHSLLAGEAGEAREALRNLRERRIRLPDGSDPLATAESADNRELGQAHMLQSTATYLASSSDEVQQLTAATGLEPKYRSFSMWSPSLPIGNRDRFVEQYGLQEFALCVGKVDAAGNQAVLALANLDMPIVLMGPCDPEYQFLVRKFAGESVTFISHFDDQLFADALAASSVFVDASLHTRDTIRVRQAAALGKPMAISDRISASDVGDRLVRFAPLNPEAIVGAVRRAIETPESTDLLPGPPLVGDAARLLARAIYANIEVAHNKVNIYDRTVALVSHNSVGLLYEVLSMLSDRNEPDIEYVIVDNGSNDDTPVLLQQIEGDVQVHRLDDQMEFSTCEILVRQNAHSANVLIIDLSTVNSAQNVIDLLDGRHRPAA